MHHKEVKVFIAQSFPTRCNLRGILQARILERVAISFSSDLPNPGVKPGSLYCREILYHLHHEDHQHHKVLTSHHVFILSETFMLIIDVFVLVYMFFFFFKKKTALWQFPGGPVVRTWHFHSNTLATWCKELTHLKRPWCWERLKMREGGDRGWDSWMTSPTQRTQVWVNSGSWWWTCQGGLACCSPWGRKELNTTEQLNWAEGN